VLCNIFDTPTVVASTIVAHIFTIAPTEEEDEEEVYFFLTQKGIDNKIMNSPPESQKRRRHSTKKTISAKNASKEDSRNISRAYGG
jgi:glycine cleavage system protein P-like pyridoxal-binding family